MPDAGGVHEQVAVPVRAPAGCPPRRAWCPGSARRPRAPRPGTGSAATTCRRWAGRRARSDRRLFRLQAARPAATSARAASSRSPTPRPCSAEIACTCSKPSGANSARPSASPSILLTATSTFLPFFRRLRRDGPVVGQQPGAAVDDEDHEVRFVDRPVRLRRRGPEQRIVRAQQETAGVDQLERGALPGGLGVVAVARRARAAVGDGLAPAADPIEQRGLADIRPADERDLGYGDHRFSGLGGQNLRLRAGLTANSS